MPRLDPEDCRHRFAHASVATLATTNPAGGTDLVPVTFVAGGRLVVSAVDHKPKSTRRLARLRNIEAQPEVTLLAQHYSDDWDELWWVRVSGRALIEREIPSKVSGLLAAKYPQYAAHPPGGPFIVVRVERWSGWSATTPEPPR